MVDNDLFQDTGPKILNGKDFYRSFHDKGTEINGSRREKPAFTAA